MSESFITSTKFLKGRHTEIHTSVEISKRRSRGLVASKFGIQSQAVNFVLVLLL